MAVKVIAVTLFLLAVHYSVVSSAPPVKTYSEKLLLISYDGFRHDYLNAVDTPNFDYLASQGVKAPYINGTFITKTFPSHFTIATGLYEESHGITSNSMWDTVFKERFTLRTHDPKWWKDGEPIWITSVLQNRKSATFFWPGSEIVYQNTRPTHWRMYNQSVPFKTRVDQVMQWLKGDINMATLYFHEPDSSGHRYGPHGAETRAMVAEMDRLMGYIIEQMKNLGLWDNVNMIVTSDHGMQDSPTNQIIELSDYANMSGLVEQVGDYGPTCNILPKEGKTMELYNALKGKHPNYTVYLKEDLPDFWFYKNHRRILPIVVVGDEGWQISPMKGIIRPQKGTHGWDNRLMSMKPIFMAHGPSFKIGHQVEPFNQVDIYPLMCKLLGLTPASNNGTLENTKELLKSGASQTSSIFILPVFLINMLLHVIF